MWAETYSWDENFHWQLCAKCNSTSIKEEHIVGDDGYCEACDQAIAETKGVEYQVSFDGKYAEVIGYSGSSKRVIIAEEYNGVPVTRIGAQAFKYKGITSVVMPSTLKYIDSEAFFSCRRIRYIIIPEGVTKIGEAAFAGCDLLTNVFIPSSVTHIGDSAFCLNDSLRSIIIPEGVTSIGNSTFWDCPSLENIVIPKSVLRINYSAFKQCDNLSTVYYAGTSAQWNCISVDYSNDALKSATKVFEYEISE